MGSVSRVFSAVGGLVLLLLVVGLFIVPALQTLLDPDDIDFPGGRWGAAVMLFSMASVPGTGAVLLLRRAVRATATPAIGVDAAAVAAPAASSHAPAASASPVETGASTTAPDARVASAPVPSTSVGPVAQPVDRRAPTPWAPRFRAAVRHVIGTSFGRGVLTALVSVPMMIAWRNAAPTIGPMGLTIFSLIDPLAMAAKPSWWLNAFVSGTVWFVLFIVTGATADIVSDQPDIVIGFILPMIAYPAALALSGAIRGLRWLASGW